MTSRWRLALWACCLAWAAGVQAQPAPWADWALQQRAAGRAELAVWLHKQALLTLPADDPAAAEGNARLAGWLAEDGRWAEAQQLQARAQAAALAAFVGDAGHPAAAMAALPFDTTESMWAAAWPPEVHTLEAAVPVFETLLALPRPRRVPLPSPSRAAPGELHLHAIASAQGLALMMDGGAAVRVQRLAWPESERERELGQVALALGQPRRATARASLLPALQALYRRLGEPLDTAARAAGATEIVLHVQGSLRELPFAALHDGRAFLGERYAFRLAGLGAAPPAATRGPARLRALGVSRAQAGQPALPGVADELCAIVAGPVHGRFERPPRCGAATGAVDGEAWLDDAFTPQSLVDAVAAGAASGRALLHLGTHFDLRPGRMERSSVLLGDGTRWPLSRIVALDFSGHALVALAACDTGSSGAASADSLQTLILHRGAQAVLASLWRVDDASTSLLMQTFYRHFTTLGPVLALQRAQQAVRERPEWQAPFHWAGFVLASRS